MPQQLLIDSVTLKQALESAHPPLVLDCRARLGDADAGTMLWREGGLPTSRPINLDRDLASAPSGGGRHPLPEPQSFIATLQSLGVTPERAVVVYDDMGGQMAAARAWWMLTCWAGHPEVYLLDGGIDAWQQAGGVLVAGDEASGLDSEMSRSAWQPRFDSSQIVDARQVGASNALKVDARSYERFRGDAEPIDPVAGHIPGAICRPGGENLDSGRFKSAERLSQELPDADDIIAYCGSGVSACQTIAAYAVAGKPLPRLYVGSWSDWVSDPQRPVVTGDSE
ncbi:sulfurtransferase [Halomonas halocynthiae]|uniref:sulfurtransferase n=1 Tax=Halomonas halocynthiae TaxID=176290 RepID=UPI000412F618|nr:sulfurtransferase [Halomonas halocynthiae]